MFGSSQGLTLSGGYNTGNDAAPGAEASPSQATKKGQLGSESQALMPVTLRMVENARLEGAELRFHGMDVGLVLVVGIVEDLTRQQAALDFTLNDATGRIKARHFFQSAENQLEQVKEGTYINAVGVVKTDPMPHFSIVTLRPITSPDEISYHAIEVAHTKLRLTTRRDTKMVVDSPLPRVATPMAMETPAPKPRVLEEALPKGGPDTSAKVALSGPRLQEEVQAFLQRGVERAGAVGLALQDVCANFQGSAGMTDVKASLQTLCDDGLAYTTIDEEHFLPV